MQLFSVLFATAPFGLVGVAHAASSASSASASLASYHSATSSSATVGAAATDAIIYGRYAPDLPVGFADIFAGSEKKPAYRYATDLTRNIVPKQIHSHNDYWRDVPFYTALSVGAISVEADVWLVNGTLYIGHEISALNTARTFDGLYVQPILSVLNRENPSSPFVTSKTANGVFDMDGGQTLYLYVDMKTDGASTFKAVVAALEPLRQGGWLTTVNTTSNSTSNRAVTVIGTGNTPQSSVEQETVRDVFYDAPLDQLNMTQFANLTSSVSPLASCDFMAQFGTVNGTQLTGSQLTLLRSQLATAKAKGIGARYWDQPGWPISTRNGIWRQLLNEGVALINADDLLAAAGTSYDGNVW